MTRSLGPARPSAQEPADTLRSTAAIPPEIRGPSSLRVAAGFPRTATQRVEDEVDIAGLFTALLDTLPDGVVVLNRHGDIVACNPGAERITGTPASRLIGSPSTSLFEKMRELPSGTPHVHRPVFEVSRRDGTRAWLSVITRPLRRDNEEDAYGTLLYLADLTEKKLAEESSAEALSMRELIAQASNDAIWDWDLRSDRIWWSEGLRSQFGHISAAATDREWWLTNVHPDDRHAVKASWRSVFKGGGHVWLREFRFRTADGEFAWVICRGHLVRAGDGHPVRMFGAMQDVSRQRRVEDDLHQSEELSRAVLSSLSGTHRRTRPRRGHRRGERRLARF